MSRIAHHPPGLNNCSLKDNLQGTPYVQNQSFLNITARMSSYLVTGAGRGPGLEFVRQLSHRPAKQVSVIFATVRGPSSEALQELADESNGRLVILHMVLSDKSSISAAVEQVVVKLAGQGLDVHQQCGHGYCHPGRYCRHGRSDGCCPSQCRKCAKCHVCFPAAAEARKTEEGHELVGFFLIL